MSEVLQQGRSIEDYLGILRRRKWSILLPALAIFLLAFAEAMLLPAEYQARATILIEEPEVSQDYAPSLNTSFAAQQIQVISQRVLTLDTITEIVNRYRLYQDEDFGDRLPTPSLSRTFRRDMELELVSADIIDPRSRRPSEATIAFTLTFLGPTPEITQSVTNDLVKLFLDENQRTRTDQANSTSEFLADEAQRIKAELDEVETQIAAFKKQYEGMLPEQYRFNLTTLERTQRELDDVQLRIQKLRENRVELDAEISQVNPSAPVILPSGDVVMNDRDRLKALEAEYRRTSAIYRENHPDVVRLNREIAILRSELGASVDVSELERQLYVQRSVLEDLRTRYNDNYHEVQSVQRVIAQLERRIAEAGSGGDPVNPQQADNPVYVLLRAKLNDIDAELRALSDKHSELETRAENYQRLITQAPLVERNYNVLEREYESVAKKYDEIRSKQRQATAISNLEQDQKGQRFLLLEPPALPIDPVSPNRPAIIFLGAVLGLGVGVGLALIRDTTDQAVHGVRGLTAVMGSAPLVAVPWIEVHQESSAGRAAVWVLLLALLAAGILSLWYLHVYYMPLGQFADHVMTEGL